jgi:DNA-binding LytR/AlgR family response regulator
VVFVSAYDGAAVEAFELHALDYLRKPVARRRVEEAIERVAAAVDAAPVALDRARKRGLPAGAEDEMVAVANAHGGSTKLLARSAIQFVQSYGDFVRIVTRDGRYLLRATLSEIEQRWEPFGFVRVHRQYVANLRTATELRPLLAGTAELTFGDGQTIPVAPQTRGRARAAAERLSTPTVAQGVNAATSAPPKPRCRPTPRCTCRP